MRVAFVSNVVYPFVAGGAQKRDHEIGTRLAAKGHDITIYGRHFWKGPAEITYEGMTLRAVAPATKLYKDNGRRSITEAIDFATRLIPTLRSHINNHDIIVVSVFPYFPVISAKLCTILKDIPLVTTWHEVWRDYWDDYLGWLAPFGKLVEYTTVRIPQYPIAVSTVTADRLADISPYQNRITIIPNGVDVNHIQSIPSAKNGFDILFVGRLISEKNVDLLINSFIRIENNNLTLGIIGDGPKREALERQANMTDAREQITFLGFLNDYNRVLSHMKSAKIFASPSTREGFGITYLEAMAANCIVIGAKHPNSAATEVVGNVGYVVNPTIEDLTNALNHALRNEHLSLDSTNHVLQYDWNSVTDQVERVFHDIINQSLTEYREL